MRKNLIGFVVLALSGCASGFRAGGPNGGGVSAGAAIGPPPAYPVQRVYPVAQGATLPPQTG